MRLIYFRQRDFPCQNLYSLSNTLNFYDLVQYLNCLFVWEQKNSLLPTVFDRYFVGRNICGHNLRSVTFNNLTVPLKQTLKFGINSITYQCILSWNTLPNNMKTDPGLLHSKKLFKKTLTTYFTDKQ